MRRLFRWAYELCGHVFCRLFLCYYVIRDFLCPPKEDAILFVAHPDDDTLFFHTFIKERKPYVVLCTTGWSLRRVPSFIKAMRYYGVKFRFYDLKTDDKRDILIGKIIKTSLSLGDFKICASHNAQGEYGHEMHKRINKAVLKNSHIPVLVPICSECLSNYPLEEAYVAEKEYVFNNIYKSEKWVLKQYRLWVKHERLEMCSE